MASHSQNELGDITPEQAEILQKAGVQINGPIHFPAPVLYKETGKHVIVNDFEGLLDILVTRRMNGTDH